MLQILLVLVICCGTMVRAQEVLPYTQVQNVVYAEVHGTGLLMDIFTPTQASNGLAIIDVASGAWYSDRSKIRDHTLAQLFHILCGRGYTVFAIRPGSKSRYTILEMERHVHLAIGYVKEHAKQHAVDSTKIGLTGASAGGHLAMLAALSPRQGDPNAKERSERHDTHVAAVAVFFPPTDFIDWKDGRRADTHLLAPLLFVGASAEDDRGLSSMSEDKIIALAKSISPLYRITKPQMPCLLIHGDADQVVPLPQSQKLAKAIQDAGSSAELIVKAGGGHPWLTLPVEVAVMADWFARH